MRGPLATVAAAALTALLVWLLVRDEPVVLEPAMSIDLRRVVLPAASGHARPAATASTATSPAGPPSSAPVIP